jgi:hypothetical protein
MSTLSPIMISGYQMRCDVNVFSRVRSWSSLFGLGSMRITFTALPITSAGRFWPFGPVGHDDSLSA